MYIALIKKFFLLGILTITLGACAERSDEALKKAPFRPDPTRKISELTFVAFDTETTGLSARLNRILEIGAVEYREGEIVDQREWLLDPGEPIPFYATQVHGIDDQMVAGKPSFAEVYPEFLEFVDGAVLIAHNSRFDRDFMLAEMERAGIDSDDLPLLDSLKLFRKVAPDLESHSIGKLVEYYGVEAGNFHRALIDSVYILRIMEKVFDGRWDEIDLAELVEMQGGPDQL
jgi:DNA polymerase III epsilon subunit family exonuclease